VTSHLVITISMLCGNSAYCVKLSVTKLNQLAGQNVRIITILPIKRCHSKKHFSELAAHCGGKTAGTDDGMKKLRHCHPVHTLLLRLRVDSCC